MVAKSRGAHVEHKPNEASRRRTGRAPSTSRLKIGLICIDLFTRNGFENTSIDDIAAAAGVSRRTFFRYFPSKSDAVWGNFDDALVDFEAWFANSASDMPLLTAVSFGVLKFNTFDPGTDELHRQRMRLILDNAALQAHSALRYREWRMIIARFVASRMQCDPEDLLPRVIAHLALGASLAAYEQWLAEPGTDLLDHLSKALHAMKYGPKLNV